MGSTISDNDNFEQEIGVPQRSILSVTLFSITASLYCDDFVIQML